MTDRSAYLRAGEIARLMGISERTVRRLIASDELPSVKLGGARLVPVEALEKLLSPPDQTREETAEEDRQG